MLQRLHLREDPLNQGARLSGSPELGFANIPVKVNFSLSRASSPLTIVVSRTHLTALCIIAAAKTRI